MSETVHGHADLLPCPHCGSAAKLYHRDDTSGMSNTDWVSCEAGDDGIGPECGAGTCLHETPAEAIAAWNRRTPIAAHGAGVTEAHIDLVLDAAGDYMGAQYGNTALLHPTDRARIKATLARPDEAAGQGEADWTDEQAFELARRMCVAHGGDPDAPVYRGHGEVGENWQVYLPMAAEALIFLKAALATPRPAPVAPDIVETTEEELAKILVKIWGYKWVEFDDIPMPGEPNRDRISEAYSNRLNAQDAVRGLMRRFTILRPDALAALRAGLAVVTRERDEWRESATEFRGLCSEWQTQADTADAEVARLKDENKELVAGLEPFAKIAEWDIGDSESDEDAYRPTDPKHAVGGLIKVGDLRRARSLTATNGG